MAKKGRRRRKGEEGNTEEHEDADGSLPEDFTIAGSVTSSSAGGLWDYDDDNMDDDAMIGKTSGTNRAALAAETRQQQFYTALAAIEELPTEKRTSRRETLWRRLFATLVQAPAADDTELVILDAATTSAALYSLKHGPPSEQYAVCRVLQAWALVFVIAGQCALDDSLTTALHQIIQSSTASATVRGAALRAWALSVVFEDDGEVTEVVLDLCEAVAQREYRQHATPPTLRIAALENWSLIATTMPVFYIAGNDDATDGRGLLLLPLLRDILVEDDQAGNTGESNMDLRAAAGEAAALIHECRLKWMQEDDPNHINPNEISPWENSEWEIMVDEIQQAVASYAVQSGHHQSKKDKKAQRATFREYAATLVENEGPDESVALRNQGSVTISSWNHLVPLKTVRATLQGGFLVQLLHNPTLQGWLAVQSGVGIKADGLSHIEKRLYMSKASEVNKEADRKRTQHRDKRERVKHHFLTVDGDDI
jgi:hypothetical protein